jgi:hypothetical protein
MAGCGLQEHDWISFVWLGSDSNALAGEVDGCCAAGESNTLNVSMNQTTNHGRYLDIN